jgi:hypothetical protein
MKNLMRLLVLLIVVSCTGLKRINTDGFSTYQEYILYKQDTVAKLTNVELSLDNKKYVKELTFKLLDMKHGDNGKALIYYVSKNHKGWEIELDYPIESSPFLKK